MKEVIGNRLFTNMLQIAFVCVFNKINTFIQFGNNLRVNKL